MAYICDEDKEAAIYAAFATATLHTMQSTKTAVPKSKL